LVVVSGSAFIGVDLWLGPVGERSLELANTARLIQGNQAIAEGAFYAGARFYAGYPITPSSEIADMSARRLPKLGGVYMQMEDEIASIAAVIGASLTGKKSFTATSGPGFSLMQENLGVAIMGEVPCVVIDVQRVGPSTGLATKPAQADFMQIRWGRHGDQTLIALAPASVPECFTLAVTAFNLAEKFRTPVVLAADEIVGHMRENFVIPAAGQLPVVERAKPTVPPEQYKPFHFDGDGVAPLAAFGSEYTFHITSTMHGPEGYATTDPQMATRRVTQLHSKFQAHRDEIVLTRTYDVDHCEVLMIAAGAPTRAARTAAQRARKAGVATGVLQLQTIWPFPDAEVIAAAKTAKKIVVVEMNYSGQLAGEVRKLVGDSVKLVRVNSFNGQIITPADILQAAQ
jgi:2-oxoglutarate ferredoxin oxidoreductase subunit alpha